MEIHLTVRGLKELRDGLRQVPENLESEMRKAEEEAAHLILDTQGLRNYPPPTEANSPGRWSIRSRRPMGYYQRGAGEWVPVSSRPASGLFRRAKAEYGYGAASVGYKFIGGSQQYDTKWTMTIDGLRLTLNNTATYAKWLTGATMQAHIPAARGWRKISDVVAEKRVLIVQVYENHVMQLLRRYLG